MLVFGSIKEHSSSDMNVYIRNVLLIGSILDVIRT